MRERSAKFPKQLMLFVVCAALLCSATTVLSQARLQGPRLKRNFNSGWKLFVGDPTGAESPNFDDSEWKVVTTPHVWNEDDAFRKDIKDLSTGVAWYRCAHPGLYAAVRSADSVMGPR